MKQSLTKLLKFISLFAALVYLQFPLTTFGGSVIVTNNTPVDVIHQMQVVFANDKIAKLAMAKFEPGVQGKVLYTSSGSGKFSFTTTLIVFSSEEKSVPIQVGFIKNKLNKTISLSQDEVYHIIFHANGTVSVNNCGELLSNGNLPQCLKYFNTRFSIKNLTKKSMFDENENKNNEDLTQHLKNKDIQSRQQLKSNNLKSSDITNMNGNRRQELSPQFGNSVNNNKRIENKKITLHFISNFEASIDSDNKRMNQLFPRENGYTQYTKQLLVLKIKAYPYNDLQGTPYYITQALEMNKDKSIEITQLGNYASFTIQVYKASVRKISIPHRSGTESYYNENCVNKHPNHGGGRGKASYQWNTYENIIRQETFLYGYKILNVNVDTVYAVTNKALTKR